MSAQITTSTLGSSFLSRVYAMSSHTEAATVYDEWAPTFDAEMNNANYVAPMLVADAVARNFKFSSPTHVLDAGCGTGLGALALVARFQNDPALSSSLSTMTIDGADLSPGMLKVAKQTNIYHSLREVNLNQPLSMAGISDSSYDLIICVGTLTHGHVGPSVLSEFAHATKPNGVMVITVLEDIWESGGYRSEVDKLAQCNAIKIIESEIQDYRKTGNVKGRLLVLKKGAAENGAS